ncbi:oxidoreductase-like protein [Mollisia scopiformis]|uniref:Oxidoreductase-like protein n=1 Tax=Mollisia scopiformis TaxID=149040 RepID=A0A194XNF0_MOLSC|nr:oxidoreductase-like protein [Mollisia scopiformis]KUJ21634.1 oxidoreductase-like protein [Mollisia scopiformis]
MTSTTTSLPIIDLSPFLSSSSTPESRLKTAKELVQACHSTGFVYITNYGISQALLDEAFSWSKKFYSLSDEEKSYAAHPPDSKLFRGWSKVGHEMIPPLEGEKKEGVMDFTLWHGHDSNAAQPNIWFPESILPGYRDFVATFYDQCWSTSVPILRALSLGLLNDEEYLLDFHSNLENELSFRHYPSISESKVRSGELDRLGAHTDFDSFTLLWQDENAGLEVKVSGEGWKSVQAVKGALLMNIGDILSRWSNDYLISTLHRVHLPPVDDNYMGDENVRMTKPRYSIPYFVVPKSDKVLEPLEGYFGEGKDKKYEPTTYSELYHNRVDGIFRQDAKAR